MSPSDTAEVKVKMSEHTQSSCLTFIVDAERAQRVYTILRSRLATKCGRFQKCSPPSSQITAGVDEVRFPYIRTRAFEAFIDWLYEGTLTTGRNSYLLAGVYFLANEFDCPDLKNEVMRFFLSNNDLRVEPEDFMLLVRAELAFSGLGEFFLMSLALAFKNYDCSDFCLTADMWQELMANHPEVMARFVLRVRSAGTKTGMAWAQNYLAMFLDKEQE